jgi:hypothetical protein
VSAPDGGGREERELADRLGRALGADPGREPSPDRVASVRAAAERGRAASVAGDGPAARHEHAEPGTTVVRRLRRRDLAFGGLAASLGAVLGVTGARVTDDDPEGPGSPPSPPTEPISFVAEVAGAVASAELIAHTWGVETILRASGLDAGRCYRAVYTTRSGARRDAGGFLGVAGELTCRMNGAVLRDDCAAIEVLDAADERVVLRSTLA